MRGGRTGRAWILALVHLLGCTTTKYVTPPVSPQETTPDTWLQGRITGAVLRDGREIRFWRAPAPFVIGDTLKGLPSAGSRPMATDTAIAFPFSQLNYIVVSRPAPGRTIALVPVVIVGVLAAALAASSCPFVYSWDGERWVLDAEPFGGAVSKGLERDDVGALEHLRAVDGEYRLLVTNEMRETQHTNQLELLVVDHAPGAQVAADDSGRVHALTDLRAPLRATVGGEEDVTSALAAVDGKAWAPEPALDARGGVRRELVLELPRPAGARELQLLVRAATTPWGAMTLRTMLEMRGPYVDAWYRAVDTDPTAAQLLHAWNLREELFVLKVEVEEPDGWRTRAVVAGGGPAISENRVVSLDVGAVQGDRVRVRLRPPAGFWSIDAVQVAHGRDASVRVDTVASKSAVDGAGNDVGPLLARADDRYHDMPTLEDEAELRFAAPSARPGTARTVLLHSRGYYRLHMPTGGVADLATLQRITDVPDEAARWAIANVRLPVAAAGRTP